jgi:hypothetical protein
MMADGAEKDLVVLTRGDYGYGVKLNGSGQNLALVMIGVVPAKLGAARDGKDADIPGGFGKVLRRKIPQKPFNQAAVTLPGCVNFIITIELREYVG